MSWVNKWKLPAPEAIKYNSQQYFILDNLWQALHSMLNKAQHCIIENDVLNKLNTFPSAPWTWFSKEEFTSALSKCNNSSAPGPDKVLWRHLKAILNDKTCLSNVTAIANAYIELGHWSSHFKISLTIIILKPNKASYDLPKSFRPIVLLNTLGKLIEKVISDRLQFHVIANNFIH